MTNLLALIGTETVQKTNKTIKLFINGESKEYPVYRVDLDELYYNDQNDRISTWISKYDSDNPGNEIATKDQSERNEILGEFINNSNLDKNTKTRKNIEAIGQQQPAVVLKDGRVIDGNRRFTCLRKLREINPGSHEFDYIETAILDLDIEKDRKQIKILELNIQHATDEKVEYDNVDYVIGTYKTIEEEKILSVADYAIQADEKPAEIFNRIKYAKLMIDYLDFINLPGRYYYLRENNLFSLFVEADKPLAKCLNKGRKTSDPLTPEEERKTNEMKDLIFTGYMLGSFVDVKKYCRDLSSIANSNIYDEYIKETKQIIDEVKEKKNSFGIENEDSLEKFVKSNKSYASRLKLIADRYFNDYKKSKAKNVPIDQVNKSIEELRGIDTRLFKALKLEDRKNLQESIDSLKRTIERIENELK